MSHYLRPERTEDALAALARQPLRILAGGTDLYPQWVGRELDVDLLDISRIGALRAMREEAEQFRVGATVTWSDIARASLPPWMRALQNAAREVGGAQIQNTGTIGGNLCNASPAADGVPALMALHATVELTSQTGVRILPLTEFLVGNRQTELEQGELLTAVLLPKPVGEAASTFLKLGARRHLVISIAMVGALIETDDAGIIVRAGVAVGACSAVAQRLRALESALTGVAKDKVVDRIQPEHFAGLRPITDVRADAHYRREAARMLVREALHEVCQ